MPFLLFRDLKRRTSWSLTMSSSFTVGSSTAADVLVSDSSLGARDFEVRANDEGYRLVELTGKKPLLLNGAPVHDAPLATGDRVRSGNTCFVFAMDDAPGADVLDAWETRLNFEKLVEPPELAAQSPDAAPWRSWIAVLLCGVAAGVVVAVAAKLIF